MADTVAVLSEQFHPRVGGAVRYVDGLVSGLVHQDHAVKLLVPVTEREGKPAFEPSVPRTDTGRVQVIPIPARGDVHGEWLRSDRRRFVSDLAKILKHNIRRWEPRAIHVAYGHYLYRAVRGISSSPTLWTVHNVPPAESQGWLRDGGSVSGIRRRLLARGYGVASGALNRFRIARSSYDCIIAVSPHVAPKVTPWALSSEVRVVGEGFDGHCCDLQELKEVGCGREVEDERLRIVTVAGIVPHKGQHVGLRAARGLAASGMSFDWSLVGPVRDQKYAARLEEQINRFGLTGQVRLVGTVSAEDLCHLYSGADIYVQTSIEEGYCLSVLEALAHGTPVVGTDTGAIRELVSAGHGRVVGSADGEQIATEIRSLGRKSWPPSRRLQMARKIREQFSWKAVAEQTLELYRAYA